jgi:uridylate kinase
MIKVISLGGSIVAPDRVDAPFLSDFFSLVSSYLDKDKSRKLILVVGGGAPARLYQKAYRDISGSPDNDEQDWIGIAATRLNGQLLKAVFSGYCKDPLVTDPTAEISFDGQVLVAAGWKPGFSTDYDAVLLGERFGADSVINLSNITKVYTDDPRTNPEAKPLDTISWPDFIKIVGTEWVPGKNAPFDPVATAKASKMGIKVIVAGGRDIENLGKILMEEYDSFEGTVIG